MRINWGVYAYRLGGVWLTVSLKKCLGNPDPPSVLRFSRQIKETENL